MKKEHKKYIKIFFKIKIDFKETIEILKNANLYFLFCALLFFIFSKIISSFRLNMFLKKIGIQISEKQNLKLYFLGMFYNLFLPGGIGGDGYKVYFFKKKFKIKAKKIIFSLLFDRISGVFALTILILFLSLFINLFFNYKIEIFIIFPFYIIIAYFLLKKFFLIKLIFFKNTTLLSIFVQLFQLISAFLILKSININSEITSYLFIFLISSVIAIIPLTIGGIGSREITFLYAAELMNLEVQHSVALSLIFYLITVIVSFSGIFFNLKKL
ncbi:MAG: hypothetical protein B6I24_09120 [Bacteroidetes bacterium 4572_128]|nr:MAG: hypothetical protein B6I24_09120 [Bacteroidetes bacterium 4572_128]